MKKTMLKKFRGKLNPDLLPAKKEGYTIAEMAKFFRTTNASIFSWLTSLRAGKRYTGYVVARVRVDDRFRIEKKKVAK